METPVYARERLPIDAAFTGPAIVDADGHHHRHRLDPGSASASDADGNLIIALEPK